MVEFVQGLLKEDVPEFGVCYDAEIRKSMKDVFFYLLGAQEFACVRSIMECSIVRCQDRDGCFHAWKETLE